MSLYTSLTFCFYFSVENKSNLQRSDSLEMIPNKNYGKSDTTDGLIENPQYEAIPVNISDPSCLYDTLAPAITCSIDKTSNVLTKPRPGSIENTSIVLTKPRPCSSIEKTSNNPLYSSTGELRMSGVFNTYDVVPPQNLSHRNLTLSPLPSRPPSNHGNTYINSAREHYSAPNTAAASQGVPPHKTDDQFSEHLYAHATTGKGSSQEPLYSEL